MTDHNRGLFIDFDGTLADTVPMLRQTYFSFLGSYNRDGSEEEFQTLMGPPLREVAAILKENHALDADVDALLKNYHDRIMEFYGQSKPMAGAPDVLKRAHRAGWSMAVVTSAREADVQHWLDENDLGAYVQCVVGAESVTRSKPDPEPYQTALERCSCAPVDSVALEDSRAGAASATSAGLKTFIIGTPLNMGSANTEGWPSVQGFVESFEQLAETVLHV